MTRIFAGLALLLSFTLAHAAETLYVQSAKAKLLAGPSFQAPVLVVVSKGEALTLIEKSDPWFKVSYQKHTGWVSALLVNTSPPQNKVTVIKEKEDGAQKEDVRRRASSSASAAAARGLRQNERARSNEANQPDYPAVEKMEAAKINEAELEAFTKDAGK